MLFRSHFRLRRALALRYFTGKPNFTKIAEDCRVNRDTASQYNKKSTELLKAEERFAKYQAEGIMKEAGVVE